MRSLRKTPLKSRCRNWTLSKSSSTFHRKENDARRPLKIAIKKGPLRDDGPKKVPFKMQPKQTPLNMLWKKNRIETRQKNTPPNWCPKDRKKVTTQKQTYGKASRENTVQKCSPKTVPKIATEEGTYRKARQKSTVQETFLKYHPKNETERRQYRNVRSQ